MNINIEPSPVAPTPRLGLGVEVSSLDRVVCTHSMGWKLDEAGGLVLAIEISEMP